MKKIIFISLLLSFLIGTIWSETLTEKIERFGEENGKEYIQPWVTAFGTSLNTGLYQSAKVLKPFLFGFSLNSMAVFVPAEDETFTAYSPTFEFNGETYNLYNEAELETATCFGDKGATFTFSDEIPDGIVTTGLDLKFPNGGKIPAIPMFIPQANLGLPGGNELMLRGFPKVVIHKDVGEFSFWGVGLKHSVSQYIPLVPIDLAVQAAYQQMGFADILDVTTFAANAQISKKLLMWTIYGGLGFENTKMEVKYKGASYSVDEANQIVMVPKNIKFELEGDNELRATAGIRYSVLLAKFYADYTLSKYNVINIGFGLSF